MYSRKVSLGKNFLINSFFDGNLFRKCHLISSEYLHKYLFYDESFLDNSLYLHSFTYDSITNYYNFDSYQSYSQFYFIDDL